MPSPKTLSKELLEVLPPIVHHIRAQARIAIRGKLTLTQFRILSQIDQGLNTVGRLAETQGVAQPTMSKMTDGLARKGFLRRTINREDRRQSDLELTAKGKLALSGGRRSLQQHLARDLNRLAPNERSQLCTALQQLALLRDHFRQK
jgi:DNA-binding MarR family transcriptional regulator